MIANKRNKKEEQRIASTGNILSAALELFVRQGYRATTVESIAAAANLTKGAVYFYYHSKEQVLLSLLDEAERVVVDPIETDIAGQADARGQMTAFLRGQSNIALNNLRHMHLLVLMSLELSGTSTKSEARLRGIYRRMNSLVEAIIRQGQRSGEFRTDVPTTELASLVMAGHNGLFLEWYRRSDHLDGHEVSKALIGVIGRGISNPG